MHLQAVGSDCTAHTLARPVTVPHDPPFVRRPSSKALPEGAASAAEPVGDSLDAEAAALLADIEAFDIEAARRRVQEIDARNTGPRRSSTVFPSVAPDPGLPSIPALPEVAPAAAEEVSVEREKARAGGLLAQLRDEVVSRQRRADEASQEQGAMRATLDRRLRMVFDYLHDLCTQLNYLKPPVDRAYFFLDSDDAFRDLSWNEGFTDLRSRPQQEGGGIERVSFTYTLKGPGERTLERAGPGVERLRHILFDLGLRFECRELRNRQRELEQAWFTVADEVNVQLVWRADLDKGVVVLESRNLERLGHAMVSLLPESVGEAMLDEFGRLVLGRENSFRAHLLR